MDNKIVGFPEFKTKKVLLRRFTAADLENVFRGLSDPDVIEFYGVHYDSPEATKKQLAWFEEIENNGTGIWWALSSLDHSKFYGAVGIYFLNKTHKKAEIGFWLLPEFWGKGLMVEIMPFVLEFGFSRMNLRRLECFVESENTKSRKLMGKLNFIYEGTMKDCEIKNGKYISLDIYAKFNLSEASFPPNA